MSVTPQFRPAMALGRLGLGGKSDCGSWFGVAAAGAEAWHPQRCAPPRLSHLRAGGPARVPPCAAGVRAGRTCPLACPLLPFLLQNPPLRSRILGLVTTFPGLVLLLYKAESDQVFLSKGVMVALGGSQSAFLSLSRRRRPLCSPFCTRMFVDHPSPGLLLRALSSAL